MASQRSRRQFDPSDKISCESNRSLYKELILWHQELVENNSHNRFNLSKAIKHLKNLDVKVINRESAMQIPGIGRTLGTKIDQFLQQNNTERLLPPDTVVDTGLSDHQLDFQILNELVAPTMSIIEQFTIGHTSPESYISNPHTLAHTLSQKRARKEFEDQTNVEGRSITTSSYQLSSNLHQIDDDSIQNETSSLKRAKTTTIYTRTNHQLTRLDPESAAAAAAGDDMSSSRYSSHISSSSSSLSLSRQQQFVNPTEEYSYPRSENQFESPEPVHHTEQGTDSRTLPLHAGLSFYTSETQQPPSGLSGGDEEQDYMVSEDPDWNHEWRDIGLSSQEIRHQRVLYQQLFGTETTETHCDPNDHLPIDLTTCQTPDQAITAEESIHEASSNSSPSWLSAKSSVKTKDMTTTQRAGQEDRDGLRGNLPNHAISIQQGLHASHSEDTSRSRITQAPLQKLYLPKPHSGASALLIALFLFTLEHFDRSNPHLESNLTQSKAKSKTKTKTAPQQQETPLLTSSSVSSSSVSQSLDAMQQSTDQLYHHEYPFATRKILLAAAQKYTLTPMTPQQSNNPGLLSTSTIGSTTTTTTTGDNSQYFQYSGWSSMSTLTSKHLVMQVKQKYYRLTPLGLFTALLCYARDGSTASGHGLGLKGHVVVALIQHCKQQGMHIAVHGGYILTILSKESAERKERGVVSGLDPTQSTIDGGHLLSQIENHASTPSHSAAACGGDGVCDDAAGLLTNHRRHSTNQDLLEGGIDPVFDYDALTDLHSGTYDDTIHTSILHSTSGDTSSSPANLRDSRPESNPFFIDGDKTTLESNTDHTLSHTRNGDNSSISPMETTTTGLHQGQHIPSLSSITNPTLSLIDRLKSRSAAINTPTPSQIRQTNPARNDSSTTIANTSAVTTKDTRNDSIIGDSFTLSSVVNKSTYNDTEPLIQPPKHLHPMNITTTSTPAPSFRASSSVYTHHSSARETVSSRSKLEQSTVGISPYHVLQDFEVILLVDSRERITTASQGKKQSETAKTTTVVGAAGVSSPPQSPSPLLSLLQQHGIPCMNCELSVGDFLWVLVHTPSQTRYVLNTVVERKTINDLAQSVITSRFKDQRRRLLQSGMENIFYLIETSTPSALFSPSICIPMISGKGNGNGNRNGKSNSTSNGSSLSSSSPMMTSLTKALPTTICGLLVEYNIPVLTSLGISDTAAILQTIHHYLCQQVDMIFHHYLDNYPVYRSSINIEGYPHDGMADDANTPLNPTRHHGALSTIGENQSPSSLISSQLSSLCTLPAPYSPLHVLLHQYVIHSNRQTSPPESLSTHHESLPSEQHVLKPVPDIIQSTMVGEDDIISLHDQGIGELFTSFQQRLSKHYDQSSGDYSAMFYRQIPGVSVAIATTIVLFYPTPVDLYREYMSIIHQAQSSSSSLSNHSLDLSRSISNNSTAVQTARLLLHVTTSKSSHAHGNNKIKQIPRSVSASVFNYIMGCFD